MTGAPKTAWGNTRDVADFAFVLTGVFAFVLMALFVHAIGILVQQDDDKGSGR